MHEFSLAQGLHSQLLQLAEQHQAARISTVRIEVGSLSGIVVDSFSFGFEVLAKNNPLTVNTVLEITVIDPIYRCLACNTTFQTSKHASPCPECGTEHLTREGGEDLILNQVEME